MSNQLGSEQRPLRVAIIGAGPSGFYAAGALLQHKNLHVIVDMFDRLPAPYGLVRYGVAPDHQKIKSVTKVYDRTASNPNFRFFGNIDFGTDITHSDLRQFYDQVVYAVGAQSDRKLNIPGEDLRNSFSATEFVAWYNGHPDFADLDLDLSCDTAIVVGVGNVAMDVARILAKSVNELQSTDIADYSLDILSRSKIKNIYVVARRGPAQVKFTGPESREFGELELADVIVDEKELELEPLSAESIAGNSGAQKNIEILREYSQRQPVGKERKVYFRFRVSPVEIIGNDAGMVAEVRLERNELIADETGYLNSHGIGEFESIPAGLILRSVGYRGVPLEGVPFDDRRGTIPNREGCVLDPETNAPVKGEYVVGWAKRGPTGVIGTNRPDAVETVDRMVENLPDTVPAPSPDPSAIDALLEERKLAFVTIEGWRVLDQMEIEAGSQQGRPRVKFTSIDEMLKALNTAR